MSQCTNNTITNRLNKDSRSENKKIGESEWESKVRENIELIKFFLPNNTK